MDSAIKAGIIVGLVLIALVALSGLGGKVDRPGKRSCSQNVILAVAALLIMILGIALFVFSDSSNPTATILSLVSIGGGIAILTGALLIGLLLYGILTLMERWANKRPDE